MQKWSFDTEAWGALIGRAREAIAPDGDNSDARGRTELAELMEVDPTTIDKWEMRIYSKGYEWPNMRNMLNMCTLCNFDPARLFKIEVR